MLFGNPNALVAEG